MKSSTPFELRTQRKCLSIATHRCEKEAVSFSHRCVAIYKHFLCVRSSKGVDDFMGSCVCVSWCRCAKTTREFKGYLLNYVNPVILCTFYLARVYRMCFFAATCIYGATTFARLDLLRKMPHHASPRAAHFLRLSLQHMLPSLLTRVRETR